jgi:MFS transporter, PAT family, beta-lactamase induction signal transducer AmpG
VWGHLKRHYSFLFFFLYFFEGAPIGLIWWAIPTLMATQGVTVDVITTMVSLATLPWACKFLLAPTVDHYLSTVRDYATGIATFQSFMLLGLLGLLFIPIADPSFLGLILFISFVSATQDIMIDAWAIGALKDNERGKVNGAMQAGMLTGRWLFGAGLLIALAYMAWQLAVGLLCLLLTFSIFYLFLNFRKNLTIVNPTNDPLSFKNFNFLLTKKFIFLALIAVLTGFAFESMGSVVGPMLIANGYEQHHVGLILSISLLAMLSGALLGGRLTDLKGAKNIFLQSGIALCFVVSIIGLLHLTSIPSLLVAAIVGAHFFVGVFTASSYSFYMQQAKGSMEATRFTFLMAMTNLCESLSAYSVGQIIAASALTYTAGFTTTAIVSSMGLVFLWRGFTKKS